MLKPKTLTLNINTTHSCNMQPELKKSPLLGKKDGHEGKDKLRTMCGVRNKEL